MTRDEIFEGVADALVQSLGVRHDDLFPETSLVGDLEAESIDFLEIVFRLEKTFKIEVARGELFPQEMLRDSRLVAAGRVTEDGIAAIRQRLSFADLGDLAPGQRVDDLMSEIVTVDLMVNYVAHKLAATTAAAS
jgi:acyl carrier protein